MHFFPGYMLLWLYIRADVTAHREITEFIAAQDMIRFQVRVEPFLGPYAADRRLVLEKGDWQGRFWEGDDCAEDAEAGYSYQFILSINIEHQMEWLANGFRTTTDDNQI